MKKVLFILLASLIIVSCGKDDDELVYFEMGDNVPFVKPIIDWSKDYNYVKNNLPKGFRITEEWSSSYDKTIKISNGYTDISYSFDKNNILNYITEDCSPDVLAGNVIAYFKTNIGDPIKKDKNTYIWTAKNVIIALVPPHKGSSICYITFKNPDINHY